MLEEQKVNVIYAPKMWGLFVAAVTYVTAWYSNDALNVTDANG